MLQFRNLRLEFRVCWCRASEGAVFFFFVGGFFVSVQCPQNWPSFCKVHRT